MYQSASSVDELLAQAKSGSGPAVEKLLLTYKDYLRSIAAARLGARLAGRVSPSDLVQETMLAAWTEFTQFQGDNARQFAVWLRTILLHKISATVTTHLKTAKRNANREQRINSAAGSSIQMADCLMSRDQTPSSIVSSDEQAARIQQLLPQLPEEYRLVIQWRNFDGVQFQEIAERLGKSCGAVRLVWLRAIRTLRALHEGEL